MTDNIGVYCELEGDQVSNVSYEILGKARGLADELDTGVTAFLAGPPDGLNGFGDEAIAHGADRVVQIEDPLLDTYRPETYADGVEAAVLAHDPTALLVPATNNGIDLAGQLAVRLDTGLNADVVRLVTDEEGDLIGGVPAFAGGILAMVKAKGCPQMSTVRPGVFESIDPDSSRDGTIEFFDPEIDEADVVTELVDREVGESVSLPSANVVVCAGRGFGEDLGLARDLVEELDATLGVTRPLADAGLVPRDHQVGSTGYSLKADIAIVAGISGSMYFTAGLDDVDTVVAINTRAEEPIFDVADYCVEGDLFEVLPALLEQLEGTEVIA